MPGPGQYDMDNAEYRRALGNANSRSGTQLSFKSDMITGQSIMGRTKIVNPPSIPSHLNIYGYDVNETGHLIKQSSNLVGFSGNQNDQVGPGDYDMAHLKSLGQSHSGIVAWKKPTQHPNSIQNIQE